MYLKSIEVQGFKSFANKIRFDFESGITGIVGPNGSGKSNVADAVRWVFGEQSARQLRGSSMQDVIFAGTQIRKPQSFASVKITLDNSDRMLNIDYDEVSVTRKVFRSGESEYLINENACRLRDIMELFYDTGIGKEGYSVIGQGQVDKILSGRPEDRRELFDEACGIVKFKKRKAASLKKLENERASLIRVTDILKELERQAGPLQRQSETAKQYLKLRDELRVYDINAFLIDSASLNKELKETGETRDAVRNEIADKQEEERQLKARYEALEKDIASINDRIEDLRLRMNDSGDEKSSVESSLKVTQSEIASSENSLLEGQNRMTELLEEKAVREEQLRASSEEQLQLGAALQSAQEELEKASGNVSALELKTKYYRESAEEEHGELIDLLNENAEVRGRLQSLETLIGQHRLRSSELREKTDHAEKEARDLKSELAALKEKAEDAARSLSEARSESEKLGSEFRETEDRLRGLQSEQNDNAQHLQIARSRLETLRSMAERYEGFHQAVRRVMDLRSKEPGVLGVVADLFHVEERYQTAIETALGNSIQNIVTDSESTAKKMIAFLKESKAGRATFLPLDSLKPPEAHFDEAVFREAGVVGTADSLVSADKKYRKVILFLLGRFLIVDHIDHALAIARKYRYSIRIVTLDGDYLAVGGSITGGAYRSSTNLLGRSKELDSLEKDIRVREIRLKELADQVFLEKQMRDSLAVETEDAEDRVSDLTIRIAEYKAQESGRNRLLDAVLAEKEQNAQLLESVLLELKQAENEQQTISEAVRAIEDVRTQKNDSSEELQKMLSESEEALQEARTEEAEKRLLVSRLEQQLAFREENELRLKEEIEKLLSDKEELEKNFQETVSRIEMLKARSEELERKLSEIRETAGSFDLEMNELLKSRDHKNEQQRGFFDARDNVNSDLNDLNREALRLQARIEKAEEKLDSLTEYLWNEYEITPSEAEQLKDAELHGLSNTAIRKHAQELRRAIRSLGNVNVNAIEEYKEVGARYEFMKTQHADLTKAEADLRSIVEDLDRGMKKQFRERFEEIRLEFDRVFRELFGGGQGTLLLDEEADIIDADISIISQPPGKKLQNMLQLSGGERALSAIALIFAIQNLKPSPFCLLDEIEAALDESNVGRFTNYLKKLTQHTQFIVITHRRGTMMAADRLYGITMQEKGVSAMVSVNLVESSLES